MHRFIIMLCISCVCLPLVGPRSVDGQTQPRRLVLDGRFGDWRNIEPAVMDPMDATDRAVVDFGRVLLHADASWVYLNIDLGNEVNLQSMKGTVTFWLDVDGSQDTGSNDAPLTGADLRIDCSAPRSNDELPSGITARWLTRDQSTVSIYDLGFENAPTFASPRFEIRMKRTHFNDAYPGCFLSNSWAGLLEATDESGTQVDITDRFEAVLPPARAASAPEFDGDPLRRNRRTRLRTMSWNVKYGGILKRAERAEPILAATAPDVILLQELNDDDDPEALRDLLNAACPLPAPQQWHITIGEGGGNLRCAIASRFPIESIPTLENIDHPADDGKTLRQCSALVSIGDRRILLSSLHWQCCGCAGSREDRLRQAEAQAMHDALLAAYRQHRANTAIVAGDLNLVGSKGPLFTLIGRDDRTGSLLNVVEPIHLDRRTMATWMDPRLPFPPGRLDYMAYVGDHFEAAHSFVFDSSDLPDFWLKHHALTAGDSAIVSDHRPIVTDYFWR